MRYDPIPSELFTQNRAALATLLEPQHLAIIHSNDVMPTNADGTMGFQQNSDLMYLSGVDQEETTLILFPNAHHPHDREILFTKETSPEIAVWEGAKLSKEQARQISGVQRVEWNSQLESTIQRLVLESEGVYLLQNEHARNATEVVNRNERLLKQFQQQFPLTPTKRLAPLTSALRSIKSSHEINLISKACQITEAGFRRILRQIKPGVGEWEIEAELQHEFISKRSKGFAYHPIIASGKDSCVLHYTSNHKVMQDGELVLLDVAAEWANWNSDLTRTIPVNGVFTPRQKAVYQEVLKVLKTAKTELLRPGKTIQEYHQEVMNLMAESLQRLDLITDDDLRTKGLTASVRQYFMHGTSHHLGLDVHDVHVPHAKIEENMVFTVEPGIYIPEENIGIRLENNIVVKNNQNIDLMESIPIEVDEIEGLMNR